MISKFKGTGVAIVTPFKSDKSVDFKGLESLVDHLTKEGVDYLVVQGTTGESVTLTKKEKREVIDFVIEKNAGKLPIVLGIGGNNTLEVCKDFENFDLSKVDGILSASPMYNKPIQEGIYQHYKEISKVSPKPIILYNVPGRTGSNMLPSTTIRLANDFENIIAIKEASGNMGQIMQIIKNRPTDFLVISGDDGITLPMIACGAEGVISVVANVFPKEFSEMVNLCLEGKFTQAQVNHYKLVDIIDMLFAEGNPGGAKAVLKILGITGDDMRLPLVNISDKLYQQLEKATLELKGVLN